MPDQNRDPAEFVLRDAFRNRFTELSLRTIFYARQAVSRHASWHIGIGHILSGMFRAAPDAISVHLGSEWTIGRLESELIIPVEPGLEPLPEHIEVPFSVPVVTALQAAISLADALGHSQVRPQHLLAALMEDESQPVVQLLYKAGVTREQVVASLER